MTLVIYLAKVLQVFTKILSLTSINLNLIYLLNTTNQKVNHWSTDRKKEVL
jgi:hypothetical protein